jgi:hypothetical protein
MGIGLAASRRFMRKNSTKMAGAIKGATNTVTT